MGCNFSTYFSIIDTLIHFNLSGDSGSISGLGRSPGEGNSNPLQYSCLENPTDGGAWWATVHGVAKSQTQLSDFTTRWIMSIGVNNEKLSDFFPSEQFSNIYKYFLVPFLHRILWSNIKMTLSLKKLF